MLSGPQSGNAGAPAPEPRSDALIDGAVPSAIRRQALLKQGPVAGGPLLRVIRRRRVTLGLRLGPFGPRRNRPDEVDFDQRMCWPDGLRANTLSAGAGSEALERYAASRTMHF